MDISLTNGEITSQDFQVALVTLMQKPLSVSIGWHLTELKEYVERRLKKYREAHIELLKKHGAVESGNKISFDEKNPAPVKYYTDLAELNAIVGWVQMDKITLPDTLQVEPFVVAALKSLLVVPDSQI